MKKQHVERQFLKSLESVTRTYVLQLLRHLGRRSLEIARDTLLFSRLDRVELLAEITVDDIFYRVIIRSER